MQRIVHGRRYDTATATRIDSAGEGFPGDFRRYEEALYRTPNGRYFLAGEGGALTRWACPVDGGGWTNGDGIVPLSPEEALAWAETHLDPETIAAEFAEFVSDA